MKIFSFIMIYLLAGITVTANGMSTSQRAVRAARRETNRDLPEKERIIVVKKIEARLQIKRLRELLSQDKSPHNLLHINQEAQRLYSQNTDPKIQAELRDIRIITAPYSARSDAERVGGANPSTSLK